MEDIMFFKNIKLKDCKAFRENELQGLWYQFDIEERKFLYDFYSSSNSNVSQLYFIYNLIMLLQSQRKDKATQKVINYVNENNLYLKSDNVEDKHFYLLQIIKFYYHPKSPEIYNPELVKKYTYEDIEIFTNNVEVFKSHGTIAKNPSFKILVLILEKEKNYKEAIKISELALKYEQDDGTKSGFEGRIKKLNKNL